MKKTLKLILTLVSLVIITSSATAQKENSSGNSSESVSDKGYWVIQANKNSPLLHTVFFYDKDNTLVSKQEFKGQKLDPKKRKTRIKLEKALEAALHSSEHSMGEADQPLYFASFN